MSYDNTNRGTLGKNQRREKDTHPEYTGKINVEGVDYWLSAWVKDGPTGKFFSLALKAKDDAPAKQKQAAPAPDADMDEDIPF